MITILKDLDGDLAEFKSKPYLNGFTATTPDGKVIDAKDIAHKKTGKKLLNEQIWHMKIRKQYLKLGWELVDGTMITSRTTDINTFTINNN